MTLVQKNVPVWKGADPVLSPSLDEDTLGFDQLW